MSHAEDGGPRQGRPKLPANQQAVKIVRTRVTPAQYRRLDRARGSRTMSDWLRNLLSPFMRGR